MIEQIIDGIWKDLDGRGYFHGMNHTEKEKEMKTFWRLIIRKAIAENQEEKLELIYKRILDGEIVPKSSQAMLEETAVMER